VRILLLLPLPLLLLLLLLLYLDHRPHLFYSMRRYDIMPMDQAAKFLASGWQNDAAATGLVHRPLDIYHHRDRGEDDSQQPKKGILQDARAHAEHQARVVVEPGSALLPALSYHSAVCAGVVGQEMRCLLSADGLLPPPH
jgi:hypothetical protein